MIKKIGLIGVVVLIGFILLIQGSTLKTKKPKVEPLAVETKPKIEKLIWIASTSTMPWSPRDAGATYVWNNKLWLAGGLNGSQTIANNVSYWDLPHFNDIWSTTDGISWQEETAKTTWPARRSMSVVLFANQLWLLGGWSPNGGYRNDIWTSTDGVNWSEATTTATFPPREGQVVIEFKNRLWLIGGVQFDKRQTYNDVWFSSDGLNWTLATSSAPWLPRYDHAVAVFNNKLWLISGVALGGAGKGDIWSSLDGISWTLETDQAPWGKRHGHALVEWGRKLWLVSGWDTGKNNGVNDVWSSADGKNWVAEAPAPWRGREDHTVVVFQNDLWLFSGMDGDWRWCNDLWRGQLVAGE